MQNNKNFSSPRLLELKRKRQKVLRNKILIYFFLVVILFFVVSFATRWDKIRITSIEVTGNKILDTESIKDILNKEMDGYYYFIVPKDSVFFYPRKHLEYTLSDKFKRIKEISIDMKGDQTLEVYLSERKAAYTWCGENFPTDEESLEKEKCYFMSADGYIFDRAPFFSGAVYFKFYGPGAMGSVFAPDYFNKLIDFKYTILSMGLHPNIFNLKKDNDVELYLSSNNSFVQAPKIIFKSNSDLQKVAENLQAAVTTDPLKTNLKDTYDKLNYIDLRFGNKIYYKFR